MPDVSPSALSHLELSQRAFIRARLALPKSSLVAPLFTETGVWPLAYRRLNLAVRYFSFLLTLPASRLAYIALQDSFLLHTACLPSWYGDLLIVADSLSPEISPLLHAKLPIERHVIQSTISTAMTSALTASVRESGKLELLRALFFRDSRGNLLPPREALAPALQPYMTVVQDDPRNAIIRLLFCSHHLAKETLRRRNRRRPRIPLQLRLCRFCALEVEDEAHALLHCHGDADLIRMRAVFLRNALKTCPKLGNVHASSPLDLLLHLLSFPSLHALLAAYTARVLTRFDQFMILRPLGYFSDSDSDHPL